MTTAPFDDRRCALGEGVFWHPERDQLFWLDILAKRLLTAVEGDQIHWQFDEHVSAAGWVDRDTLLLASETGLFRFDLPSGTRERIAELEAGNSVTRSNDGRADPHGGFWIGTMGKAAERGAGAIYRWYRGELRQLFDGLTISNAICFTPDGGSACFTDTVTRRILRQRLDSQGWPAGDPEIFIDLTADRLNPDGAVIDTQGCLWNAQWGASRVARYDPEGTFLSAIDLPARQTSCPGFGGTGLTTLFVTSAADGLAGPLERNGMTFGIETGIRGQQEHRVIL